MDMVVATWLVLLMALVASVAMLFMCVAIIAAMRNVWRWGNK